MPIKASMLVYPLLVIVVIAFVEGLRLVLTDANVEKQVNKRLRVIASQPDQRAAYEVLRRKSLGEGSSGLFRGLLLSSPLQALDRLLAEADIGVTTERVCLYLAILTLGAAAVLRLVFHYGPFICVLGGLFVGVVLPLFYLRRRRRARLNKLGDQLPDALDMLVRSLRAGHPVPTGISIVAREMQDPIGTEFGLVADEMSYGADLKDALEKMGQRARTPDVNYMIVAIRIQYGTGGSLAEILAGLATVMRARRNLFAKVKALSAEARFGGKILAVMPPGIVALISLFNPHFYAPVGESTMLAIIMGVAGGICVLGMVMIRKIVNIHV
jgi:tight adherence protein B